MMRKQKLLNITQIARDVSQAIGGQNHFAESDITCDTNIFGLDKEKTANNLSFCFFLCAF